MGNTDWEVVSPISVFSICYKPLFLLLCDTDVQIDQTHSCSNQINNLIGPVDKRGWTEDPDHKFPPKHQNNHGYIHLAECHVGSVVPSQHTAVSSLSSTLANVGHSLHVYYQVSQSSSAQPSGTPWSGPHFSEQHIVCYLLYTQYSKARTMGKWSVPWTDLIVLRFVLGVGAELSCQHAVRCRLNKATLWCICCVMRMASTASVPTIVLAPLAVSHRLSPDRAIGDTRFKPDLFLALYRHASYSSHRAKSKLSGYGRLVAAAAVGSKCISQSNHMGCLKRIEERKVPSARNGPGNPMVPGAEGGRGGVF